MIKANLVIDTSDWKKKISNPQKYINLKMQKIKKLNFLKNKKQEFSILLTNNKIMRKFNLKFRKKNKSTDVLSFPQKGIFSNSNYIGDIAISYEFVKKRSFKSNFLKELDKLWVHGYLHLIGYDHGNLKDFKKMLNKENLILSYLNNKID